jgi:hypothetical protein
MCVLHLCANRIAREDAVNSSSKWIRDASHELGWKGQITFQCERCLTSLAFDKELEAEEDQEKRRRSKRYLKQIERRFSGE